MTADLTVQPFEFAETCVTVEATSKAGKIFLAERFGPGAVSITLRKSSLWDLGAAAEALGLKVL